jgi:hypothetical protein
MVESSRKLFFAKKFCIIFENIETVEACLKSCQSVAQEHKPHAHKSHIEQLQLITIDLIMREPISFLSGYDRGSMRSQIRRAAMKVLQSTFKL